jgi:ATP-dependent helicase/nuclease subunit A
VGASAGTGKTKVLIDRVLRLMLPRPGLGAESATPPEKILCLTFTKTAAAEMSTRIYSVLGDWAVMEDEALDEALYDLSGEYPDRDTHAAARRLFARALDTAGGLKIMTIHSFCQSVLRRFPVEAGIAPHFALMDERDAVDYLRQGLHDIIAARDHAAFGELARYLDSETMPELMEKIAAKRALLLEILKHNGDEEGRAEKTISALYARMGLEQDEDAESILQDAGDLLPGEEAILKQILEALLKGSDTDKKRASFMEPWLSNPKRRGALFAQYSRAFFTGDGKIYARLATKKAEDAFPGINEAMQSEAERLEAVQEHARAVRLAGVNRALLTVAASLIGRYEAHKRHAARLDYEDLIIRASELLSDTRMAQWVLYKLDEGIDHILVDEAQDTSPNQWRVIRSLSDEFFSGYGVRGETVRTLFVVGDEKQSIFSFQGADPAAFAEMQAFFGAKVEAVQEGWEILLEHSFRSTRAVLETVDSVFAGDTARRGVGLRAVRHLVHRKEGQAGLTELWPLVRAEEKEEHEPWELPLAIKNTDDASATLARKIAQTVRGWITAKEMLPSRGRPIRAGDVLILVQSRGVFVEKLMRALKEAGVPVAGADRMKLASEICVMDLAACARFALQPRDDLALATILKSPLIGMTEEDLFKLCFGRKGSVWDALRDTRPDIAPVLERWIEIAGSATPFTFFADILNTPCPGDKTSGRRAFYGRLGLSVHDPLDEFLGRCLHYAQMNAPVLQKFLAWFEEGEADIKREQEGQQEDQVRIMTVHASKGLQAPIVFLPDAARKGHGHAGGRVRLHWPDDASGVPLWAPRAEFETALYRARALLAQERQEEEYRRLLYVALTRAEDRVYVCGWRGKTEPKDDCWHSLVAHSFPPQSQEEPFILDGAPALDGEGKALYLRRATSPQAAEPQRERSATREAGAQTPLPPFAREKPLPEPIIAKPLAPSRPDEDEPAAKGPLDEDTAWRFRRGIIVHRILELLPQLPEVKRAAALKAHLARLDLPPEDREAFAAEITAVLAHPDFAAIFGPGSKAEAPVTGIVGETQPFVLSGQIDRLLVTEEEILIVDYKTNRPPPKKPEGVAPMYLKQMAAYRAVMRKIYPGRAIRCALLWTDGPRLMPLPDGLLDRYAP